MRSAEEHRKLVEEWERGYQPDDRTLMAQILAAYNAEGHNDAPLLEDYDDEGQKWFFHKADFILRVLEESGYRVALREIAAGQDRTAAELRDGIESAIRKGIKVDATGLAPAVASHFIFGFEESADAILSLIAPYVATGAEERAAGRREGIEAAARVANAEWFSGNRHRFASEVGAAIEARIRALLDTPVKLYTEAEHERFVEFVHRWATRPNCSDQERISAIANHPTVVGWRSRAVPASEEKSASDSTGGADR